MRAVLPCFIALLIWLPPAHAQQNDLSQDENYAEGQSTEESGTAHQIVSPGDLETTRAYQTENLVVRNFDEVNWKKVVSGVDYSEEQEEEEKTTGSESRAPFAISWDGPLFRIISYIIAGVVVLTLLYFVVINIPYHLTTRKGTFETADPDQPLEDIESLDTRTLLEDAIRDGNLKLAVRLYYLNLLKQLNEKGLIAWKKDKTNRDYQGELLSRNIFFDDFRHLTLFYESVWYGDHDVKAEAFKALSDRFETVLLKINNREEQ